VEVVGERAFEKAFESHGLWRSAVLSGSIEEIAKSKRRVREKKN
jgi:hypothetical protein